MTQKKGAPGDAAGGRGSELKYEVTGRDANRTIISDGSGFVNNNFRSNTEKAIEALHNLDQWRADERDSWLYVGMALHSVDAGLFDYWDEWSKSSEKYDARDCTAVWNSFSDDPNGYTIGSLIKWAAEDSGTTTAKPITPRAKPLALKPQREKIKYWPDAKEAISNFNALQPVKDNAEALDFLKRDYALDPKMVPNDWRVFHHRTHGVGIVYRGYTTSGETTYKYKSLKRNGKGKRYTDFLYGGGSYFSLGEPSELGLVIVGGEEKAALAASLGFEAFCSLTGEKCIANDEISLLLNGERPTKFIIANDNDADGQKANLKSAEALEAAGYPGDQIYIIDWPTGSPVKCDLNDAAKRGGVQAVARLLENSKCYKPTIPPLNCWNITQLFEYQPPENDNILGDHIIAIGEACLWVGPPDIGKSRILIQYICDLLLGKDWFNHIQIHRHDLSVLIIQTENNPRRLQMDIAAQLKGCTATEREHVNNNLHFLAPLSSDDRVLNLDDPINVERIKKTVALYRPDLVVFDPYGDFFMGDNENDASQARKSAKAMINLAQSANPNTAVIIIHHSRSGKTAAAGADGWDRGAYARGSKALSSIVRSQINLAPGDKDGETVVVACGKSNNGAKFPAFAVRLDPDSMTYAVDHDFDMEAWGQEVSGRRGGAPQKVTNEIFKVLLTDGAKRFTDLCGAIEGLVGCSRSTAKRAIERAEKSGVILKGGSLYALPQSPAINLGSRVKTNYEPN